MRQFTIKQSLRPNLTPKLPPPNRSNRAMAATALSGLACSRSKNPRAPARHAAMAKEG